MATAYRVNGLQGDVQSRYRSLIDTYRAVLGLNIAIFGGTFDPIHSAHLQVARQAAEKFGLDKVIFIPAANPPHKPGAVTASYEDRFRMVELACGDVPDFEVSDIEAGGAKSYSIHTIELIRKRRLSEGDRLFFIIGTDAFADIATWYRWRDVIALVEFIVVSRPGHKYDVPAGATVHRLNSLALRVSSSEIRRKLEAGEPTAELPASVLAYIRTRRLYGAGVVD